MSIFTKNHALISSITLGNPLNSQTEQQVIFQKALTLKSESGSHSPSIATLMKEIPEIRIEVDACFLSNPYATDLFMKYLDQDLIKTNKLREILEFYPPQNYDISRYVSKAIGVEEHNIFVGNGAIEIIQAVLHRFVKHRLCVVLPTFSSYYEFVRPDTQIFYYALQKENNFVLDIEQYVRFVRDNKVDSIVLINPNNPNGGYLPKEDLENLINSLSDLESIIIDESFIHFAYENAEMYQITSEELIERYPNIIIVKSMSKDFGIAGIRAGYAVMNAKRVSALLKNGFLWNVSGLADYFFKMYSDPIFQEEYDIVRRKYIMNTQLFMEDIKALKNIKVYPSKANFVLVELGNEVKSFNFTMSLLIENGVYVRDCSDKMGLDGNFIRIASRSFEENLKIIAAIKKQCTKLHL
jgi:histidinol-phosphate/aromatic aminotransferase/cobyric acid decarboxylase-like protein